MSRVSMAAAAWATLIAIVCMQLAPAAGPAPDIIRGAVTGTAAPATRVAPVAGTDAGINRPVKDKWALVVGISKFANQALNLKYPEKDAEDFYNFLIAEAHFQPDHVRLLINEQATRTKILSALGGRWLPRAAHPDDLVVIYISSHGSPASLDAGGVNYILAYDSDPEDLYATGIAMQDLARIIKGRVHCQRVAVILDACHSGAASPDAKGMYVTGNVNVEELVQGTGQLVISSSQPNQVSWESREQPNSVFTRHLLEGLRSKGPYTKLTEAFDYMKEKVEDEVLRERGVMQTPVLRSKWEGNELVLAVPPVSPRPAPREPGETQGAGGRGAGGRAAVSSIKSAQSSETARQDREDAPAAGRTTIGTVALHTPVTAYPPAPGPEREKDFSAGAGATTSPGEQSWWTEFLRKEQSGSMVSVAQAAGSEPYQPGTSASVAAAGQGQSSTQPGYFLVPSYFSSQPKSFERPEMPVTRTKIFAGWRGAPGAWGGWGAWGGGWGGWGWPWAGGLCGSGYFGAITQSEMVQTGPSKRSGNYYAPSTADPSASGNYYATGSPASTVIFRPSRPITNFWGQGGNPYQKMIDTSPASMPWNR